MLRLSRKLAGEARDDVMEVVTALDHLCNEMVISRSGWFYSIGAFKRVEPLHDLALAMPTTTSVRMCSKSRRNQVLQRLFD